LANIHYAINCTVSVTKIRFEFVKITSKKPRPRPQLQALKTPSLSHEPFKACCMAWGGSASAGLALAG